MRTLLQAGIPIGSLELLEIMPATETEQQLLKLSIQVIIGIVAIIKIIKKKDKK